MIISFKHKGLRDFFLKGITSKINSNHVKKIRLILFLLHNATSVEDCNFPGSDLHKLKGDLKDYWSVKVSGNWRIIFQFIDGNVYVVNYLDYH